MIISHLLDLFGVNSDLILPSLISSIVLITLFVLGRLLDSLIERKRNSQEWYMKMVLEPNILALHNFFEELLNETVVISKKINKDDSLEQKTLLYEELTNKKRKIEFNFILLVSKPYPNTASNLTEFINSTLYCCVEYLDLEDYGIENFEKFEQSLMICKAEFFEEIYNPFRLKSLWKWFKKNYLGLIVIIFIILFTLIIGNSKSKKNNPVPSETSVMVRQG